MVFFARSEDNRRSNSLSSIPLIEQRLYRSYMIVHGIGRTRLLRPWKGTHPFIDSRQRHLQRQTTTFRLRTIEEQGLRLSRVSESRPIRLCFYKRPALANVTQTGCLHTATLFGATTQTG